MTLPSTSPFSFSANSMGRTSGFPHGSFADEGREPASKTAAKTIAAIDGNGHRASLALFTHDIGVPVTGLAGLSNRIFAKSRIIGNSLRSKNILAMGRPSINDNMWVVAGRKRFRWGRGPVTYGAPLQLKRLRTAQRVVASRGKPATQPSRPPRDCDRARPEMTRVSLGIRRWLFVTDVPINGSEPI